MPPRKTGHMNCTVEGQKFSILHGTRESTTGRIDACGDGKWDLWIWRYLWNQKQNGKCRKREISSYKTEDETAECRKDWWDTSSAWRKRKVCHLSDGYCRWAYLSVYGNGIRKESGLYHDLKGITDGLCSTVDANDHVRQYIWTLNIDRPEDFRTYSLSVSDDRENRGAASPLCRFFLISETSGVCPAENEHTGT